MKISHTAQGFSLLEVLMAVSLGAMGFLAAGQVLLQTGLSQHLSKQMDQAYRLALNALEVSLESSANGRRPKPSQQAVETDLIRYTLDQTVDVQTNRTSVTVNVCWITPLGTEKVIQSQMSISPINQAEQGSVFQLPPVSPLS